MDLEEMKNLWQNQEQDAVLSGVATEHLIRKAKFSMHKFEKFIFFAVVFYLSLTLSLISSNVFFELFNFGQAEVPFHTFFTSIPSFLAIGAVLFYVKKKYNSDMAQFIKTAIRKIKAVITVFILYIIYVITALIIRWNEFISVVNTNSTISGLTIFLVVLIISYLVYLYLIMLKPVYYDLTNLKRIISSQ